LILWVLASTHYGNRSPKLHKLVPGLWFWLGTLVSFTNETAPPRYNWNIVENDVKHQNLTPLWTMYILLRFLFCELNNPCNWRTFILPYPLIILILFYNAKTKGGLDGQVIKAQKPNTTDICFVWILSSQFVISVWFFLPQ
jgi:hypothetical protein